MLRDTSDTIIHDHLVVGVSTLESWLKYRVRSCWVSCPEITVPRLFQIEHVHPDFSTSKWHEPPSSSFFLLFRILLSSVLFLPHGNALINQLPSPFRYVWQLYQFVYKSTRHLIYCDKIISSSYLLNPPLGQDISEV